MATAQTARPGALPGEEAWSKPARGFGEERRDGEAPGRWGITGCSLKVGAAEPSSASTCGDRSGSLQFMLWGWDSKLDPS